MKTIPLLILTIIVSISTAFSQENLVKGDSQAGVNSYLELPHIEVIPIKDTKAGRQYELYIKLPEGYSDTTDTQYPVIYYTDAMWHVEMLSGSVEFIVEEAILVGISWQKDINEDLLQERGAHVSRYRDYSIMPSSNPEHQAKYQFGQGSNHLTFIRNDVIAYVEKNYLTDPDKRTYFGYSMGGKFGAYVLLTQPDTFKNYILGSPSLWRENPYFSELESPATLNANVFISYGSLEKELSEHIDTFIAMLKAKNDGSLQLNHVVIEGSHQTAFPMTAVRGIYWLADLIKRTVYRRLNPTRIHGTHHEKPLDHPDSFCCL